MQRRRLCRLAYGHSETYELRAFASPPRRDMRFPPGFTQRF